MYKITPPLTRTYSEIEQSNPLRWVMLYKEEDGSFTSQTGKIKCKDYFNEVVQKYNTGKDSYIYGFSTKDLKLNTEGVYLKLYHLVNYKIFEKNIHNIINSVVEDVNKIKVDDLKRNTALLFIPRYYFNSTYLISLVTWLIRVSNVDKEYSSLAEALDCTPDGAVKDSGKVLIKEWGLTVPEPFNVYWFYAGPQWNSEKIKDTNYQSIIHNNGVMNWALWYNGVKGVAV